MAIKKHRGEELELAADERATQPPPPPPTEDDREVNARVIALSRAGLRSQIPCFGKRSVAFVREHTQLKRSPATMTCPNCLQCIETIVERRCTSTTHLSALCLLPVCLCALPYWSRMLRDSVHRCPSCGIALGAHFASAHEGFVTCCMQAQYDRHHVEGRCAATSGEAQFF